VWFDPSPDTPAITYLSATLDTLTALALDQTVSGLACTIGRLGDQTSLNTRRATALGMLADPQHVLDLTTGTDRPVGWSRQARPTGPATLYLHVDARHLETGTGGGTIEQLGAGTLTLLADWLTTVGKSAPGQRSEFLVFPGSRPMANQSTNTTSGCLGPLSDPAVRRERAQRANAASRSPDASIRRLRQAELSEEQVVALKAIIFDHDAHRNAP
jgi:hypothetical protein